MTLLGYIDESYDGLGSHTAVLAGYVAKPEAWLNFIHEWDAELKGQGKSSYSATKKIFSGGKSTRQAERFYRIIERHVEFAFSVTANIADYRRLIEKIVFPAEFREIKDFKKLNDPLTLMYQALFELSLHEKENHLKITDPVSFIFDDTEKYRDLMISCFKYMYFSAEKQGIGKERLGDFPIFGNDKDVKPLQAADLLARLIRSTEVNGQQWDGSQMPWKKNKRIPCLCVDLDEKYFSNRLRHAFSEDNLNIYSQYNVSRAS